jgi:hypothetical protein
MFERFPSVDDGARGGRMILSNPVRAGGVVLSPPKAKIKRRTRYLDVLQGNEKADFEAADGERVAKASRRMPGARPCSRSGCCSWWRSARPDAAAAPLVRYPWIGGL